MGELTKAEMIEFYAAHIDPTSPARAKLVVNLIAQASNPKSEGEDASAKAEGADEEKKELETAPPTNGTVPVVISDVRDYKASLVAGSGARPIAALSEFLEIDPKL